MEKTIEKIPTWAICAIVNDDYTGLSDNDIEIIKKWFKDTDYNIVDPIDCEQYFTWYPAFGLPCDVIDCYCLSL